MGHLNTPLSFTVAIIVSTQPRIRFDLKKLNDPRVMSAFQPTIGGRFAPLASLVDEDTDGLHGHPLQQGSN